MRPKNLSESVFRRPAVGDAVVNAAGQLAGESVIVRPTQPSDFQAIIEISQRVYREDPWTMRYLWSQWRVFPEGQLVAVDGRTGRVCGMAASLIVDWDEFSLDSNWCELTDNGYFSTHNPAGRTLYGAEVMVDPRMQGRGVGKRIYTARRRLCRDLGLDHIRAGARLRGYHRHADTLSVSQYVHKVVAGELSDPTLSFQLKQGFRVIGVTTDYLPVDSASQGHAAVIEWRSARLLLPDAAVDLYGHPVLPDVATA